jgi:RNA recognition motif-containing protein
MNEEGIRKRIHTLLEEIQNEADPVLLNRCRSIFRQEVSFFRRSYAAAYLLLLAEEGKVAIVSSNTRAKGNENKRGRVEERQNKKAEEVRNKDEIHGNDQSPHYLSEDESVRLFISIGRNRKVFPREILALVNAKSKVAREDIGAIRVLDNYSFIQVRTSAADAVIEALNGQNYRGRTLTVNYARSRREGEEDSQEKG